MKRLIKIFNDKEELANATALEFINTINKGKNKVFIAFSGGNTPLLFFKKISELNSKTEWNKIHFFWVDERCVPPEHPDSNFGMMKKNLLDKEIIPAENIHRIKSEIDPTEAAKIYAEEIKRIVPSLDGIPCFNWIFLGVGDDGHTASIFPNQINLINTQKIVEIATHPESGQKRITLTGNVINNATRITFMVTGESKKEILKRIINKNAEAERYPAFHINSLHGKTEWYLDKESASLLNNS